MRNGTIIFVRRAIAPEARHTISLRDGPVGLTDTETFRHYGIVAGKDSVIHFAGETIASATVRIDSLDAFTHTDWFGLLHGGSAVVLECHQVEYRFSRGHVLRRAKSKLNTGFDGYDLLTNNCEHFATWCASGRKISTQVVFVSEGAIGKAIRSITGIFARSR